MIRTLVRLGKALLISIIAMAVIGGIGVYGAFFWEKPLSTEVRVVGESIELYQDAECTTPLTELQFGDIRQGEASSVITGYLRNEGNLPLYAGINQTGIDPEISLYEDTVNLVPASPTVMALDAGLEVSTTTTTLAAQLNSTALIMDVASTTGFPATGILKVNNELIYYGSIPGGAQLGDLVRGYLGTTPAIHPKDSVVTLMQTSYVLDPDEVVPVPLHLEASLTAPLSQYSFVTTVYSQDSPF